MTTEPEAVAWEWFARAHPHEAHDLDPDRFWLLFQTMRPGVSREEMVKALKETAA